MGDLTTSYVEILNLVHRYPELIDSGDFEGVGDLLRHATLEFQADDGSLMSRATGADAIAASFTTVRLYRDGTPGTRHVISNEVVEIDEEAGTAICRYYITVFQRTDDFPLQPVWANRYEDRLERVGGGWSIVHRRGYGHLPGDTSHHLDALPET